MTIEELARALYEPLVVDENPCDVTQWDRLPEEAREVWRSCARSILPLIATELAGVLRKKTRGDVLLAGGEMSASELRTAMAVLSWASASMLDHARKMGEA